MVWANMERQWFVVILVLMVAACGTSDTHRTVPVAVAPTAPSASVPVMTTFILQGPAPAVGPGQTVQLQAIGHYSDGSDRDMSSDASWTSTQPQIARWKVD